MATVYLARDVRHNRQVAVKVLHPELSAVLGGERFLKEIELTANLQHPHILPLFDSGEAAGQLFYVMPFVEGETLRGRLEREKQLPMADALQISREVADALQYAHERGVIHRDIKPENILLQGGHALVADFGIALAVQQAGGTRMTQTGLSLGTPQYMSPEQAMGEKTIDARTDIYALGAVTYEMLTGEPPFSGATSQAIVAKVLTERPMAPTAVRDTVSPAVEQAVLRALAKLPADRFGSAAEFASALASTATAPMPAAARPARGSPGVLLPWSIAAVAVGLAAWGWLRPGAEPQPVTRVAIALPENQQLLPQWRGMSIALSPDGKRLAYLGTGPTPATQQVWLRPLDALDGTAVPNTTGAETVEWSSDGQSLLISTSFGQGATIVSASGGEATPMPSGGFDAELAAGGVAYLPVRTALVRWTASGTTDTIARFPAGSIPVSLTLSSDTKRAVVGLTKDSLGIWSDARLLSIDLGTSDTTALGPGIQGRWLPDGRLLVVRSTGEVYLRNAGNAEPAPNSASLGRVAVSANSGKVYPQLTVANDGTIVMVTGDIGLSRLTWLDAGGTAIQSLATRGNMWGIALSPDGRQVAYSDRADDRSPGAGSLGLATLWVENLGTRVRTRLAETGLNVRPSWSPDGRSVLFTRVGRDGGAIERHADGSAPEQNLVNQRWLKHTVGDARWLPDHRTMFIRTFAEGRALSRNVYLVTLGGTDSSARPFLDSDADEMNPTPSPDGALIAYNSTESGTEEVYVQPYPSGQGRLQVSEGGGGPPRWSRDGTKLYYWNARRNLVVATLRRRPQLALEKVSEILPDATPERGSAQTNVLFDVAPDGRVLVAEPVTNSYQLVLVRNALNTATRP